MSLLITENHMSSEHTPHTAEFTGEGWRLSWLPDRLLDRDQATTAMVIAETVARTELHPGDRMWFFLTSWAAELDLAGPDAVTRASQPPTTPHDEEGDNR
jgi:hypothetical protein